MYAIRSYYENPVYLPDLGSRVTMNKQGVPTLKPHRITSYNVCYTKLLRENVQQDSDNIYWPPNPPLEEDESGTIRITGQKYFITERTDAITHNPLLFPRIKDVYHGMSFKKAYILSKLAPWCHIMRLYSPKTVITSYSIHYTKLYDRIDALLAG